MELVLGEAEEKKEVIWRCAGSLAAPANCRLVRGADIDYSTTGRGRAETRGYVSGFIDRVRIDSSN